MEKILIWAVHPQRFLDHVLFAKELDNIDERDIQIFFFIGNNVRRVYPELISELKFRIINAPLKEDNQPLISQRDNQKTGFVRQIAHWFTSQKTRIKIASVYGKLKKTRFYDSYWFDQEKKQLKMLRRKYNSINPLFDNNDFDLVFVGGDRHVTLGYEPAILKICEERGIPTVIPYLVYPAEEEGLTQSSKNKHIDNRWFVSRYIVESQEKFKNLSSKSKYFYPHTLSNALDKFGTLSKYPWYMGFGKSTILCLPNQAMVDKYISKGIPENKIKLLGDISYDTLYNQYAEREKLKAKIKVNYNLDFSKQCVLVALPQLAEHNILSWDEHWIEIDFLLKTLKGLNLNILVSLHPKMDRNKYIFIEDEYNCNILNERLVEVLPVADLFLATFSSTVLWSVLCGIKTIVVDFYNFNYTMYDFLETVNKVNQKSKLKKVLVNYLSKDIDFTSDWRKLSRDEVFDGKTMERYVNLIEEISGKKINEIHNEAHK